jgi:hypothetical protein|tara:strand:+ start:2624 stop:2845 length:222 start_codon:yes stop_codon:yes gene_type:complete
MIKTFIEFVNEELETEGFYDDLEDSQKRLKLIPKFKSEIKDVNIESSFTMGEPKKKFKPKVSKMKKPNDKGMF